MRDPMLNSLTLSTIGPGGTEARNWTCDIMASGWFFSGYWDREYFLAAAMMSAQLRPPWAPLGIVNQGGGGGMETNRIPQKSRDTIPENEVVLPLTSRSVMASDQDPFHSTFDVSGTIMLWYIGIILKF